MADLEDVKSYWGTLTPEQQFGALTVNLQTLQGERLRTFANDSAPKLVSMHKNRGPRILTSGIFGLESTSRWGMFSISLIDPHFAGKLNDVQTVASEASPDLGMQLQRAVQRLQDHGTIKMWSYQDLDFYQEEALALQESILPEHLRAALPTASQQAVDHEAVCALLRKISGIMLQTEDPKISDTYASQLLGTAVIENAKHQRFLEGVKLLLEVAEEVSG